MEDSIKGDVAVTVPIRNGEILLLRRSIETSSTGKWALPGGKIKQGEEASEAALRELKEETGLQGDITDKGESYVDEGELGKWRLHPFLVKVEASKVELNHEHSEYSWVKKHGVEEKDTLGELKALEILDVPE